MNRFYNVYLARNFRESVSGPQTQVILCKEHWKRYKTLAEKELGTYALKGPKIEEACWWCEDPEDFEKLERES